MKVWIADDSPPVAEMLTALLHAACRTRPLVTSNRVSPQLRAGCAALGADGYFDKVKELTALAGALARIARAKRGGPS